MPKSEKTSVVKYIIKSLDYTPAEYVVNARDSYILFYQTNPETGKRQRFRPTFSLNRIKDLGIRAKRAHQICKDINKLLPKGYPFANPNEYDVDKIVEEKTYPIDLAFKQAIEFKAKMISNKKTMSTYIKHSTEFVAFCRNSLFIEDINQIKPHHAHKFIDHIKEHKSLTNRTINNYVTIIKTLFFELLDRELIASNPFSKFSKLKVEEQIRREFNDHERRIVAGYIMENDKFLFIAILLEFYCFLRPADIRLMKFGHINLKRQTILTPSGTSKNKKTQYVTIPDGLQEFLIKMGEFERFPQNWYVFGKNVEPGPEPIGVNTLNYRHSKILALLLKSGALLDITGLSLYSWKYSGNQMLFDLNLSLYDIKNQNRHSSITTTEIYARRHAPVIQSIKKLRHDITK